MTTPAGAEAMADVPAAHPSPGRIGPNAVIRLVEAVADAEGREAAAALLAAAKLGYGPDELPEQMVDEAEVVALHRSLLDRFGEARSLALAAEAGRRTGDYLLANRIPKPAQAVLRVLPPGLASRVLLAAITRHAWTFAGSGRLEVARGAPLEVAIVGGPLLTAGAAASVVGRYYGATFEQLYRALVSPRARAHDTVRTVPGMTACHIELDWR